MKNISSFIAVSLFMLIAFASQAGEKIGIRAGYQMSSFSVDGSMPDDTDKLNSFYFGVFKEKALIPLLRFGYGLDFMQNGTEYATSNKYLINYISVPLYVKAKIGPIYGLTGIGASFKLSDKVVNKFNTTIPGDYVANDFDLPIYIGAGFKFLMLSIEARYNWGMIEVNDVSGIKNQYLQIGATVSF